MRPELIDIEGFGAFRERTIVDFADVDLFGFTGTTGSGKSTLIDAMVFALYGSVPRYEDNRLVAPAISQGGVEAKVHLRFSVDGQTYTAVRVVRRTKTGATTKEARLEREEEVIAGDVAEMNEAIEALLGLNLGQFTTCVVLPQGQFAALLHAKRADRQDLLIRLLDLGLYRSVGQRARQIAREAKAAGEVISGQLADLADATVEAVATARQREAICHEVADRVEGLIPELDRLTSVASDQGRRAVELERRRAALTAIERPAELRGVADELAAVVLEAEQAQREADEASRRVLELERGRADMGEVDRLRQLAAAHEAHRELVERVAKGQSLVLDAQARLEPTEGAVAATRAAAERAESDLTRVRRDHVLADVAAHVHAGDDCPLCGNTVSDLPEFDQTALAAAEAAVNRERAALADAEHHRGDVRAELARFEALLDTRSSELDAAVLELAEAPDPAEITRRLLAITEADDTLTEARTLERAVRGVAARAAERADRSRGAEQAARRVFGEARDAAAEVSTSQGRPPSPEGADLAADWEQLLSWCSEQIEHAAAVGADLDRERTQNESALADARTSLHDTFAAAGRDAPDPAKAVRVAHDLVNEASQSVTRLTERLTRQQSLAADLERQREAAGVHTMLGGLLDASGFEQWLLGEALDALVEGASVWLGELSSGAYALDIDDDGKEFFVIDRRDADQRRLAKTLSGGETFLASLALALALAERISDLAAVGAPRLESIFLDEGFGTLDPQTLDVVASAIEELGATGRMVGVISHVAELAERLPTVFEVRKSAESSTVERIDR